MPPVPRLDVFTSCNSGVTVTVAVPQSLAVETWAVGVATQAWFVSVDGSAVGVLATVGASAPFIGLFGTVWGIMNAFTNIAAQQQTNLAVVAPGIAEALFATALGLVAAIPAVIFYNKFTGDLDRFGDRLETFSDEVAARLSRRLSERG